MTILQIITDTFADPAMFGYMGVAISSITTKKHRLTNSPLFLMMGAGYTI